MPLTSPYTSRSSRISAPSGTPGKPFGRQNGVQWFISNARIALHECLLPVGQRPLGSGRRQDLQCNVDGRQLWRWATALNLVGVPIFETMHAPSGFGLVSSVCLFPAENKARGDNAFTLFFSDRLSLRGIYDGHRLEIEYSLPFGFDCFQNLRSLFDRQVVPGYLVGVPSTEVKLSMQRARLGRRDQKYSVFLAFPDVRGSSLFPRFLDVL